MCVSYEILPLFYLCCQHDITLRTVRYFVLIAARQHKRNRGFLFYSRAGLHRKPDNRDIVSKAKYKWMGQGRTEGSIPSTGATIYGGHSLRRVVAFLFLGVWSGMLPFASQVRITIQKLHQSLQHRQSQGFRPPDTCAPAISTFTMCHLIGSCIRSRRKMGSRDSNGE